MQVQSYRKQYGASYISAMPTNLYGPGDNFDLESSHVLPALIRRFHEASAEGREEVTLWGSGTPRREFLHVDDLAAACAVLLERYDGDEPVNIGCGEDLTIRALAETVAEVTGFEGLLRLGHLQAGRDAPQAAGRHPPDLAGLEARHPAARRHRVHLPLVAGLPDVALIARRAPQYAPRPSTTARSVRPMTSTSLVKDQLSTYCRSS